MRLFKKLSCPSLALVGLLVSSNSFAAGLNHYQSFLKGLGVTDHHTLHDWQVVPGALLITVVILVLSLLYKHSVDKQLAANDIEPRSRFSPANFVELVLDFVFDLVKSVIGPNFRKYLPLMVGLFVFIFFNNVSGLVPGFPPSTESLSTNLALALTVFASYNYAGIKEHGFHYLKQFTGPIAWLAFMMIPIELISHAARPLSLSLRLYINLYADHLILGVFSSFPVVNYFVPGLFMLFGLLVCGIQAFIFVLLTGIYIAMAESHDH